ncbi:hypothetical protein [Lentzea sp. NPDC004782]|uniref:hypothetical protein n=1 Tax=Lentzea sp. NPDC004782 TaxID=3154458 RepID=UPI0033A96BE0
MTGAGETHGQSQPESDPCAPSVDYALNHGWSLVPSLGHGVYEGALTREVNGFTDFVTLPRLGHALVARFYGGPTRDEPRKPGTEWFRHYVPIEVALNWILVNADTDELLHDWIQTDTDSGSR